MRPICVEEKVKIPKGIVATVKGRSIKIKGQRGSLRRSFSHLAIEMEAPNARTVVIRKWFGTRKQISAVRTICSHIENMMKGVTTGYMYKMRAVYAHFPINCVTTDANSILEIRNFLGEKQVRRVTMPSGVKVSNSKAKDELIIQGNDLEKVSQSAARIQQSTFVRDKDIRKFLDGLYVSEKTTIDAGGE